MGLKFDDRTACRFRPRDFRKYLAASPDEARPLVEEKEEYEAIVRWYGQRGWFGALGLRRDEGCVFSVRNRGQEQRSTRLIIGPLSKICVAQLEPIEQLDKLRSRMND